MIMPPAGGPTSYWRNYSIYLPRAEPLSGRLPDSRGVHLPEICHVQPDVAADCGGVPEALQICRWFPLIYLIQAFSRLKRGGRRSSQLRFVPGIVFSDWVASTMMGHVARSEPGCGRGVPFNPSLLAAATAAVLAFVLATPVEPVAAQGWNP